jgi:SAM-dependent methyltransferase
VGNSYEDAVRWYRARPDNEAAILANYFDLPVSGAAARYAAGEEFIEVLRLLGQGNGRKILDLGAGNGIASYGFAKAGWKVVALEPGPSAEVGAAAIRNLSAECGLDIEVEEEWGESLPFADGSFDAVFGRQVLHHARDLETMIAQIARVLRPGGSCLCTREHVADTPEELAAFLAGHAFASVFDGENAFPLARYRNSFSKAGLSLEQMWGYHQSILNFAPGSEALRKTAVRHIAGRSYKYAGMLLCWSKWFQARQLTRATRNSNLPGRLYSFLLRKGQS